VEGLITFQGGGAQFTFLRQFHHPLSNSQEDKVFIYYGFGGHLGYTKWSQKEYQINGYTYRRNDVSFGLGLDANIGIEYYLPESPIVISLDYKPFVEINFPQDFRRNNYDIAISIKYVF
jgi:hypothetical protein